MDRRSSQENESIGAEIDPKEAGHMPIPTTRITARWSHSALVVQVWEGGGGRGVEDEGDGWGKGVEVDHIQVLTGALVLWTD